MAVKCSNCGTDNTQDSEFCKKCASPLIHSEEKPIPTQTLEAPKEELTTGSTFAGRYQIIEELGRGGMGKVYKATDTKINEKVALKLIKPEIASDKRTLERFGNELRIARKIVHKNVGRMYDINEEEGTHYITMEYVSGQDLKGFIRQSGQMGVGTAISIIKQVCEGLSEAHKTGVIHRDLKPSNIMIDREGSVRIMDFGIARSLKEKGITGAGVMIGTPEYMSPEQAEAKEIDQRSDIYSLGVILYEMVTGRVPFEGDTALSIAMRHKGEKPKDPKEYNAQIPENLSKLILKCLEKNRDSRFQSAGEIQSELNNIEKGIPTTDRFIPKRKPITSKEITVSFSAKRMIIPALAIIAVAVIGLFLWHPWSRTDSTLTQLNESSVAVLPFDDFSPQKDQEYFCDGMTAEIITKLSRLDEIKVVPRTSVEKYKKTEQDIKEIGQELGVASILEGSIRKEQDNIRIDVSLIKVSDRSQLWSETYDQKLEGIFSVQSNIAGRIANALMKRLTPADRNLLLEKPTENIEAYNLYLLGRHFWNKRTEEDLKKAIENFEKAIGADPNFAMAYSGISDSYIALPYYSNMPQKEALPRALEAALKALELNDSLAEAHTSLGWIKMAYEWDWSEAEREFKRAIEINPNYTTAHNWYGYCLLSLKRFEECIAEFNRALEIEPLSLVLNRNLGEIYYYTHQYDKALEITERTLEMDPNYSQLHQQLGWIYLQKSMYEDALKEFQIESRDYWIGITYAKMGRMAEAKKVLNDSIKLANKNYLLSYEIAKFHFVINEIDLGFKWMERAIEEKDPLLIWLSTDPLLDDVRSDPRFKSLLKKINLE